MIATLVLAALLAPQGPTEQSTPPTSLDARAEAGAEPSVPRTLFLHGGRIHLGDGAGSVVEALLVEDGRVVAAGTEQALGSRLNQVNLIQIDLKGAVAVPGFQDAHGHILRLGEDLVSLDLSGVSDRKGVLQAVATRAAMLAPGEWLLGYGLRWSAIEDGEDLSARALSEAAPKNPVFLRRVDGHTARVNLLALENARLDEKLDAPPRITCGRVLIDEDGYATGEVQDEALHIFERMFPVVEEGEIEARILAAQEALLEKGWTCVHDMGVSPKTVHALERLRDSGELRLRVVAYLEANAGLSEALRAAYPSPVDSKDQLSVIGAYFQLDGALSTRSAALIQEYSDDPKNRGQLILTENQLTALVHEGYKAGLQPAVAAVGDRANQVALDVYERMLQVDENFAALRPRIEHAQVISPRDFPRFPGLEILPSMQPTHAIADMPWIETRLGEVRSRGAYAWRSLAPGLMELAFGTDEASGVPDPLRGIHAARTRQRASGLSSDSFLARERLDGRKALAGYTSGPAYAARQEDRRGRLSPGYWADVTILDVDPTSCKPEELLEAKVLMTLINGDVVYRR